MITSASDYTAGATKVLTYLSLESADIEAAEREVFPQVFSGVTYDEADTDDYRSLFADCMPYFTFCQICRNENQSVKFDGQATERAESYGQVSKLNLLNVWAMGVRAANNSIEDIQAVWSDAAVIAKIKI